MDFYYIIARFTNLGFFSSMTHFNLMDYFSPVVVLLWVCPSLAS